MPLSVVTGAAGFIGSAVVRELLKRGETVRAILEPQADVGNLRDLAVERVEADVRDQQAMVRALTGASTLYHLAAIYRVWVPDPTVLWSVNIDGTVATLLAAQKAGVPKIVYTSSISAIGARDDGGLSDETTPFNLWSIANDYIQSKYLSDNIALEFARAGLPVVVVLPGFPFGPRDATPTPTGNIVLSILRGEVPALSAGGFSAIDVDDCAAGHLLAAERGRVGERYILSNHNVAFSDFIRLVCSVAGKKPPRVSVPGAVIKTAAAAFEWWSANVSHKPPVATVKSTQYLQRSIYFDNQKARRELSLPQTPLEDSIRRAINWFVHNQRV